ncbi:MAG: TIGR04348 family glycosyltransferase [Gemmataceae bacterium]|nr:TIGR04348 family glycosyltransferase [Gemmataceae bacterium]MDW8263895.1 selenoneine biosynthesis selenosugar synthase SenB [Gemmataceae bacterium]
MNICLLTPSPLQPHQGQSITAQRWAGILRKLGQRVTMGDEVRNGRCDLLVALNARRCYEAIARFRDAHPGVPLVLGLTGSDLYEENYNGHQARLAMEWATRLIVLQPLGVDELPTHLRSKARVIIQSLPAPRSRPRPRKDSFDVCVLAHLRAVKDPLRAAAAARMLPPSSQVQVLHLGAADSPEWESAARQEEAVNPRYHWLGERPRAEALRILARSRLLVFTSRLDGGGNVIPEALATGVPVLASRIPGIMGLLGPEYPGYFPVGDTEALAALMHQCEHDSRFYRALQNWCRRLRSLVSPVHELRCWRALLREMGAPLGRQAGKNAQAASRFKSGRKVAR